MILDEKLLIYEYDEIPLTMGAPPYGFNSDMNKTHYILVLRGRDESLRSMPYPTSIGFEMQMCLTHLKTSSNHQLASFFRKFCVRSLKLSVAHV